MYTASNGGMQTCSASTGKATDLDPSDGIESVDLLVEGGGRQDLAHPIGNDLETLIFRRAGHPFPPLTRQVWYRHLTIAYKVELRFSDNPPATGTSTASFHYSRVLPTEHRAGNRVWAGRPRLGMELAVQNLTNLPPRVGPPGPRRGLVDVLVPVASWFLGLYAELGPEHPNMQIVRGNLATARAKHSLESFADNPASADIC